ncbi:MAG: N-acetylmuramoyl-L-alanine amidase-like domain-containing protein [Smithella sp.]
MLCYKFNDNRFNINHFKRQFKGAGLSPGNLGNLVCSIGCYFLGAPYKPGTLESSNKEKLIINFEQFDCLTFVETILALTRCVIAGKISKSEFQSVLRFIRYRRGIISGYSSRLHYLSDWLWDNEQKKILNNISKKLGAATKRKNINYMTAHRTSYPALENEDEFRKMLQAEKNISRRNINYINKNEADKSLSGIQDGDIIAFVSAEEGLDMAHVGFAAWKGRILYLLHASSKEGSVVIPKKSLSAYLKQNKKFCGIIIARPFYKN